MNHAPQWTGANMNGSVEQLGLSLRDVPGSHLVALLHGALGPENAAAALKVLLDGFEGTKWNLGADETLTEVKSFAQMCLEYDRVDLLSDVVLAGAPASRPDLADRAAWLDALTRALIPLDESNELSIPGDYEQSCLFWLATQRVRPGSQEALDLALAIHPDREDDIEDARRASPEAAALIAAAQMRTRLRMHEAAPALTTTVSAQSAPRRRARAL